LKAIELLPPNGNAELRALLGKPETPANVARARELLRNSGAEDFVIRRATELTAQARQHLNSFPDNHYRKLLNELLEYLTERNL
jgi:geranylgeranyl pyrophosphate synthase